jgi:TolB-like protein/DNA-binding winged helix-turn-helix (wHTH) protein
LELELVAENNPPVPRPVLRFGVFQVNWAARELRKHGVHIRLPSQPFCILSMLLERPGEVITRDEMRAKLWASDTFVDFEHSLNSAIKKLRHALGDSAQNARYIETLPKVGYRFIAPVEEIRVTSPPRTTVLATGDSFAPPSGIKDSKRRTWQFVVAVAFSLIVLVLVFSWSHFRSRPQLANPRLMLAILPFENLTGDTAQDYFTDGLTEEIVSQLGRLDPQRLGVIGLRTSAMHLQRTPRELDQIVRDLGVQYVLGGSVRRDSNQVRIAAKLIQTKDQTHVFAREYDRELSNVLSVQGEIAREVADEIQLALGEVHKPAVDVSARQPVLSPQAYEAYDLYLKGRYFWNKRNRAGFDQAAASFQQAIVKAPNYARAYAGLADTYALMSSYYMVPQGEFIPKARAAALKALQLDEGLAEAHVSLSLITEIYDWDWQTAEKEYRRAIQVDPSYATAHQWYAEFLAFEGRFDEAFAESERARQLDPLSLIIAADNCAIFYYSRQYDRAIQKCRDVLAMEPNVLPRALGMITSALVEQGRFDEAMRAAQMLPGADTIWTSSWQAYIHGRAGHAEKARHALKNMERAAAHLQVAPVPQLVMAYIGAGEKGRALELLQKAYVEHSGALTEIKVCPIHDPLRSDPRFQELLHNVGLSQ